MVLDKIWAGTKWTAETIRGAAVVLANPNAKIPPSELHPRMMAHPLTVGEWIRMTSWRHIWKYQPSVRFFVISALGTFVIIKTFFPEEPRQAIKKAETAISSHKHEKDKYYGYRQAQEDKKYFKKYDPLKVTRPDAFGLVYGGKH